MWPSRRVSDLLGVEHPIIQAPMAGSCGVEMALAASRAGGLGSLPCALLNSDQIRDQVETLRQASDRPFNLNFFCHEMPDANRTREKQWRDALRPYYAELGLDPDTSVGGAFRRPFDEAACVLLEELRPPVVSFHFGLPPQALLARVKAAGCRVLSSATTVAEARWLEERGVDAIIAQGCEAGGHRGMFLKDDIASQPGTFALVPQVVDAVSVPVIAAGGIADDRGVAAAFALGGEGVQIGTALLRTPESKVTPLHRALMETAGDDSSMLTRLFSGRPARGLANRLMRELGPMASVAPDFPLAGTALQPLKTEAEKQGRTDFSPLWAGQAVALAKAEGTETVIRALSAASQARLCSFGH
ncbi:MAG: nitronate monooxygenase family protein [Kiloniellales bacterium]